MLQARSLLFWCEKHSKSTLYCPICKISGPYIIRILVCFPHIVSIGSWKHQRVKLVYFDNVLLYSTFGNSIDHVMSIFGAYCCTSRCTTTKLHVPFIWCASHCFQLSVQELILEVEETFAESHKLIVKHSTQIMINKLFQSKLLSANLINKTRWTSELFTLSPHVELRDSIEEMDDKRVDDLLLNTLSERRVGALVNRLKEASKEIMKLQLVIAQFDINGNT